jgi:hypothetical protein
MDRIGLRCAQENFGPGLASVSCLSAFSDATDGTFCMLKV